MQSQGICNDYPDDRQCEGKAVANKLRIGIEKLFTLSSNIEK